MPALTINTDNVSNSRSSSPVPPPISPLTPTFGPTHIPPAAPPPRQTFTHTQPDQVGIAPPAPAPIAFDTNPDVIALKSAISVLQIQRQRAAADIQALDKVKSEAIEDSDAFLRDLADGKVGAKGDVIMKDYTEKEGSDDEDDEKKPVEPSREWSKLPTPQNIVRCPPINWSQYAVVGESLDKLHAEQISRPVQGTPAVIGAGGTYEFKGGEGRQEKYPGVASPYSPGKDKIERKPKGKR